MSDVANVLIEGRWVRATSRETREIRNPATLDLVGVVPECNAEDVAAATVAIAMANDSRFGLGANVYTRSLELAMKAMEHIKAGTFWVNDPLTDNEAGPFGGMRWSGVGRELDEEDLDAFREPKHVHIDYLMEAKSYWYPYRERTLPNYWWTVSQVPKRACHSELREAERGISR